MPGPEALVALRAMHDRALAFTGGVADHTVKNVAQLMLYFLGKSLMVDEASTGLQHAEGVCAAIAVLYDHYEFPSTHEKLIAANSADHLFHIFTCARRTACPRLCARVAAQPWPVPVARGAADKHARQTT